VTSSRSSHVVSAIPRHHHVTLPNPRTHHVARTTSCASAVRRAADVAAGCWQVRVLEVRVRRRARRRQLAGRCTAAMYRRRRQEVVNSRVLQATWSWTAPALAHTLTAPCTTTTMRSVSVCNYVTYANPAHPCLTVVFAFLSAYHTVAAFWKLCDLSHDFFIHVSLTFRTHLFTSENVNAWNSRLIIQLDINVAYQQPVIRHTSESPA